MQGSLTELPDDLPVPEDDGAADHLAGMALPDLALPSTGNASVHLSGLQGLAVLYLYPMTGRPDTPLPQGWDGIPGARGCTPQACAFRDHRDELEKLGVDHLFGISTQTTLYQREAKDRLHLPFDLLSDETGELRNALQLPAMTVEEQILLKRLTMIARDGVIEKIFYPVFPPDRSAADVVEWLTNFNAR